MASLACDPSLRACQESSVSDHESARGLRRSGSQKGGSGHVRRWHAHCSAPVKHQCTQCKVACASVFNLSLPSGVVRAC
eukprot:11061016-Alexandrium_andersonii.AAC.1